MAYGTPAKFDRPAPVDQNTPTTAANKVDALRREAGYREPVGEALGFYGKRKKGKRDYLTNDLTGGYESVLQQFEQGGSSADAVQSLLTNFKGTREELADFMEVVGPMMGGLESRRLEQSPGLDYMSNEANWDMGAMGSYGASAGAMGQGARQSIQQSRQGMAAQGLGRGTGQNAITAMLQQQNSANQSGLQSQLQQQAARNKMSSANSLFDAHRTIAQLALGQQITPRITSPQGSDSGIGGVAGGAASGAGLGASIGGPWGALIGAGVGAGYGAYQNKQNK